MKDLHTENIREKVLNRLIENSKLNPDEILDFKITYEETVDLLEKIIQEGACDSLYIYFILKDLSGSIKRIKQSYIKDLYFYNLGLLLYQIKAILYREYNDPLTYEFIKLLKKFIEDIIFENKVLNEVKNKIKSMENTEDYKEILKIYYVIMNLNVLTVLREKEINRKNKVLEIYIEGYNCFLPKDDTYEEVMKENSLLLNKNYTK